MTDHDLKRLKDIPVPAPRAEAKAAALAAARAAYDSAGHLDRPEQALPATGGAESESTQGDGHFGRQTHASANTPRSRTMRQSRTFAMAASIAAIAVTAPAAFYVLRTRPAPTPPPSPVALEPGPPRPGEQTTVAADRTPPQTPGTEASLRQPDSATAAANAAVKQAEAAADASRRAAAEAVRLAEAMARSAEASRLSGERLRAERQAEARAAPPTSTMVATRPPPVAALPGRALGGMPAVADAGRTTGFIAPPPPTDQFAQPAQPHGRDQFEARDANPVKSVVAEPVSTFSIDVDTASYSFVRRSLNAGRLPPKDAVRVEEMINYFPYDYPRPETADVPFQPTVQVLPSPWNATNQLVHIAIKGYELKSAERPRANLVLLVDISGSMMPEDRLPLLKNAFRLLLDNLRPEDTVAIVTYASGSDVRLQPTKVAEKARILAAIDSLRAGGSTAGAAGIQDAYRVAEANFDKTAVNRVILATDGDWNVGITNRDELKGFIERKRETGIYLSILGVGMGNHNDALMQALAQHGNGAAAYIDTLNEARKVLVDEASSTLFPIAKDVKIQLEFNPQRVSEYRLIGYETRMLRREDFNNDKVDAGDVGSGHSVTAIYEITPVGAPKLADDLRYQRPATQATPAADGREGELGFLKLRYKLPKEEASRLLTVAINQAQVKRTVAEASAEARFSVAVAAFGQLLRGLPFMQRYTYDDVIALANGAKGEDAFGYRAELVNLVRLARAAAATVAPAAPSGR